MSMIQPFGVKLYRGVWKAHRPFFAKTVMVKEGDVDQAMRLLNKFNSNLSLILVSVCLFV